MVWTFWIFSQTVLVFEKQWCLSERNDVESYVVMPAHRKQTNSVHSNSWKIHHWIHGPFMGDSWSNCQEQAQQIPWCRILWEAFRAGEAVSMLCNLACRYVFGIFMSWCFLFCSLSCFLSFISVSVCPCHPHCLCQVLRAAACKTPQIPQSTLQCGALNPPRAALVYSVASCIPAPPISVRKPKHTLTLWGQHATPLAMRLWIRHKADAGYRDPTWGAIWTSKNDATH